MGKEASNHIVNELTKFGTYTQQYQDYEKLVKVSTDPFAKKNQEKNLNLLRTENDRYYRHGYQNKEIHSQLMLLKSMKLFYESYFQNLSAGRFKENESIVLSFWLCCRIPFIVPEILKIFQESSPEATPEKICAILAECSELKLPQEADGSKCYEQEYPENNSSENLTTESGTISKSDYRSHLTQNINTRGNKRWVLRCSENQSFDFDACSFGIVDYGQHPPVGGKIAAFLEISMEQVYPTDRYSYGFKKVRVRTDISTNNISHIDYSQNYRNPVSVGSNGSLELHGSGAKKYWELSSSNGILKGDYELKESEIFTISPDSESFSFNADLAVNCHDMSISKTDGSPLPKINKVKIIEAILIENLEETISKNGFIKLSTQKILITPAKDNE